jgi:FeS assembly protein IscX
LSGDAVLHWDASFEIVLALKAAHPDCDLDAIGLEQLRRMIVLLPGFVDDPKMASDAILSDILRDWFEET